MKRSRVIILVLVLALALSVTASAAAPKVINYTLYTDIVAKINGHNIRSYNIDGWTAVVAEDLRVYGFYALWNGEERTLKVVRATNADGSLQLPYRWGEYTPEKLTRPVGSRAKPVYDTDIKTYVAGREVKGFNIGGETLIWIDDLAPYGSVVWSQEKRVIELTLGDPVDIAVSGWVKELEYWKNSGGPGSHYEIYDGPGGRLFVGTWTGTPHGSQTNVNYVKTNGEVINVTNIVSSITAHGLANYLNPSDIAFEGSRLSFTTPAGDGTIVKCVVDLNTGALVSADKTADALESWSVSTASCGGVRYGDGMSVTVRQTRATAYIESARLPGEGVTVTIDETGLTIMHDASFLELDGACYGAALAKLAGVIPSETTGESLENSDELRAAVAEILAVELNGVRVTGDLYSSQGSNHYDLVYRFDSPLALAQSDALTVTMPAR